MTFRDNPDDPTLPPSGDTASSSSTGATIPQVANPETLPTSDATPSAFSPVQLEIGRMRLGLSHT